MCLPSINGGTGNFLSHISCQFFIFVIMDNIKIDIVIPVYNESGNIEANLDALAKGIPTSGAEFRCVIVYDFDEDNTLPVIERISVKYNYPVYLLKNASRGALNAIKTGIMASDADYVIVTMADLSDDYAVLGRMAELAAEGYDLVAASRYMKGGKLHGGPFFKQLFSRLAGLSLHLLTRIPTHDITNSFKLYRTGSVKSIEIESTGGFEIGMEITAKTFLAGGRIVEIPTQWWDRTDGQSKFQLMKWLPKYLKWYFYLIRGKWFGAYKGA